jgi:hypothetical protein
MDFRPSSAPQPLPRRQFLRLMGALALTPAFARLHAAPAPLPLSSVLVIGDSMALCGFGPRLDELFRQAGVRTVNTYMACGTQPLSWTTLKAYAGAKSLCGYWKIETDAAGDPVSFQDTYGMRRGHRPARHPVPKIESLVPEKRPDILVVQLGNNLFDLLKGKRESSAGAVLEPFIKPFLARVADASPPVQRIYWVAPPVSGIVTAEAQNILVDRLVASGGDNMRVIDSRTLMAYPYRNLQADKQHFFGADMHLWAEKVFAFIEQDLAGSPLGHVPLPVSAAVVDVAEVVEPPSPEEVHADLVAECSLETLLQPYRSEEIAPYHESLVGFVYRVRRVLRGDFKGDRLVVLHAAHIGGKRQPMHLFARGQTRTMRLIPVDRTPWGTLKSKDDLRFIDLERFISEEEHRKLAAVL